MQKKKNKIILIVLLISLKKINQKTGTKRSLSISTTDILGMSIGLTIGSDNSAFYCEITSSSLGSDLDSDSDLYDMKKEIVPVLQPLLNLIILLLDSSFIKWLNFSVVQGSSSILCLFLWSKSYILLTSSMSIVKKLHSSDTNKYQFILR